MKRFYVLALAVALLSTGLSATVVSPQRASRAGAKHLDISQVEAIIPGGAFDNVQLINTGVSVADVQSGRVSVEELQRATFDQMSRNKLAPHSDWPYEPKILSESMSGFTSGSQSSPVKVSDSGGAISCKQASSDNLYGWEVYSIGDGMGALIGSGEFRVTDIDYGVNQYIGIWVAALQNNAAMMCNYIEGDNGNEFLLNASPTTIPYDGSIYFATLAKDAYTNSSGAVVHAKVSLLIMNSNGTTDTNLAFAGIYVSGKRFSGTTPQVDPDPEVEVGVPTNVSYQVAADHKTYSVNFTKGTNSTHTQIYSFVDVDAKRNIITLDLLNDDFSNVNAGTSDYSNPYMGSCVPEVFLDAIPGGLAHWPVLVNGALGFYFDLTNVSNSEQCDWAGFETSDYDLTATGGVATIDLEHYATDGAAMRILVAGLNKSTKKYEVVDEALIDGNSLQWDGWQQTNITTDPINANIYDLKHIYFAVGTTMDTEYVSAIIQNSGGQITDWPVVIYYKTIKISLKNIAAGSKFSYLDAERQTTGTNFPSVPCPKLDTDGYTYHFTVRGMNVGNTISFGPWYVDPATQGDVYVVADLSGTDSLEASDSAPAEYYNLQGVRVHNPAPGQLLIRKQSGKAEKVVI